MKGLSVTAGLVGVNSDCFVEEGLVFEALGSIVYV